MLAIVARAFAVRPSTKLGPSTKIQRVVGTRAIDLGRPANLNRPGWIAPMADSDQREG